VRCTGLLPYEVSYDNVKALATASVDRVAVDRLHHVAKMTRRCRCAASTEPLSPVGVRFADYLRATRCNEEILANQSPLDEKAPTRLLRKHRGRSHFRTWKGQTVVSVKFVVRRDDSERHHRCITRTPFAAWNSAFSGVVAQTNALQSYPAAIRDLLGELYRDPAFLEALGASKAKR
jgi:hypothetical protein